MIAVWVCRPHHAADVNRTAVDDVWPVAVQPAIQIDGDDSDDLIRALA
jgi:hypothetical protein